MKRFVILFALCSCLTLFGCNAKNRPEAHLAGSVRENSQNSLESNNQENFGWGEEESLANSGSLSLETSSDAYKEKYGRSTAPLYPVYFSFDSSTIHETQLQNINDNVDHLLANSDVNVVIEGNTDNRGTREYNLGLGEKRAQSVKHYLIENGIDAARLSTLSFGAMRPLFNGNSEDSWARNRRADFVTQ